MAVNWYWKHKVGEVILKTTHDNKRFKLEMFGGNVMCAFIYRYTQINEQTKKKEKWHNFFFFLDDIKHAKTILQSDKDAFKNLTAQPSKTIKFRLCVTSKEYKYSNQEMLKFAKLLTEYGYKVELY